MPICYQCDEETTYLFADARCKDCTRLTPEEVVGNVAKYDRNERRIACLKRALRTLAAAQHMRGDMLEIEAIITELGGNAREAPHRAIMKGIDQ